MINELKLRRSKLCEKMKEQNIDACLVSAKINLYYLTGKIYDGYFYITQGGEARLFVKRMMDLQNEKVFAIRKPEQIMELILQDGLELPKRIMIEDDYLSAGEWLRLCKVFPDAEPVSSIVRQVRTVKTDYEVNQLTESATKHSILYSKIKEIYKPNMTDLELSAEIEKQARLLGHLGIFRIFGSSMEIFMGSILAGDNSQNLSPYDFALGGAGMHPSIPIGLNGTRLQNGMTVMVDMSGNFTGYITDMTRIFSIGEIPQKAYDLHKINIEILNELSHLGREGVSCGELYEKAISMVENYGVWEYYMGNVQQTKFVGHGVGLEINEGPVLSKGNKMLLQKGMTIAIEPKFVLPGTGAIGNENTYLVCENGLKTLTIFDENIVNL